MIYIFIRRVLLVALVLLTAVYGLGSVLFFVMALDAMFKHHVMGEAPQRFPHGGPSVEGMWLPSLLFIAINVGLWRLYFWFYRTPPAIGDIVDATKPT